jgi:hypothetical protein
MHAGSLPIYWGNPEVARDFNPRSFINAHDWPNLRAVIEHIIEVDRNDDLYCEYLRQPWFHGNVVNRYVELENVLAFLTGIIENPSPSAERVEHSRRRIRFDAAADTWDLMRRRLRKSARKLAFRVNGR